MDLMKISNQELLLRLEKLSKTERKITHLVLWNINEIESRKLYADLGFGSMYEYLTKHLGYGESSAYRRIQSARLLKQIPHLAEKIEEGSLNLTQLTQVQKCLKEEKKMGAPIDLPKTLEILEKIENKSSLETQKVLAIEFNQPIHMHEVAKPQRDNSTRLEITFTGEQMKTLTEAKELLSHTLPESSWAEVITFLAKKQIEKVKGKYDRAVSDLKNTSNRKGNITLQVESVQTRNPKSASRGSISTQGFFIKQKREHIRLTTKRELHQRANGCCEYQDPVSGTKCDSRYQLQVDHCIPLARGGTHDLENLRLLCRTHNLLAARQWGLRRVFSEVNILPKT
ncbi:HNH endonuclease [Bdellovibrio sp. HCB337]|uniref:HNH endonuclease n=1 Tax=Bdellovibrio sp. HCB337 TaxID=3394358 RepID=UPI0039A6C6CB